MTRWCLSPLRLWSNFDILLFLISGTTPIRTSSPLLLLDPSQLPHLSSRIHLGQVDLPSHLPTPHLCHFPVLSPPPLLISPRPLAPNPIFFPPALRSPSFRAAPRPASPRAHRSGGEARALVPQEVRDGGGTEAGVPAPPRRRSAAPPP